VEVETLLATRPNLTYSLEDVNHNKLVSVHQTGINRIQEMKQLNRGSI
jgi:hypothetical protein